MERHLLPRRDQGVRSTKPGTRITALLGVLLVAGGLSCSRGVPNSAVAPSRATYDPLTDLRVNPTFLSQPYPSEGSELVDTEATLVRRLDGNPTSLNPIFNLPWQDHYIHNLLFVTPFRRDVNMDWIYNGDVVLSAEESEDHKTFVLELSPAVRWQDGRPWTAHDIEFSFSVIADDSVPALFYKRSVQRLASVRALGDHTIEYRHKEALATRTRDMPHTWIYDYANLWAFSNRLRGVEQSVSGPILFYPGPADWWMARQPGLIEGD